MPCKEFRIICGKRTVLCDDFRRNLAFIYNQADASELLIIIKACKGGIKIHSLPQMNSSWGNANQDWCFNKTISWINENDAMESLAFILNLVERNPFYSYQNKELNADRLLEVKKSFMPNLDDFNICLLGAFVFEIQTA